MLSCHLIRLEQDDLRSLEHVIYFQITHVRSFLLTCKIFQFYQLGIGEFYILPLHALWQFQTWGISVTLVTQCNTQPAGICTCAITVTQWSTSWKCTCAITIMNQPAGLCTYHSTTALSQLDCAHLRSQYRSTQPAGLCTSMITVPQHSASWNVHIYDHGTTALSQLERAHLWSEYHSTQPAGLCMCTITVAPEHFNRACTFLLTCLPWLCLFFFSYFYTIT